MKLILASSQDPAAQNISERLLELYDFERYPEQPNAYIGEKESVAMLKVEGGVTRISAPPFDVAEVIVASRHASEAGRQSLTVHVPGELEKRDLALASPSTVKSALNALVKARDELGLAHDVSLEATHHGPTTLNVPVTFVEIGSKLEQWQDRKAGEAAASAIMEAARETSGSLSAVGVGGPHYAPRHTEAALKTNIGIGHIIPKYIRFTEELLEDAVRRTSGGAEILLADWKGMSAEQRSVCRAAAEKLKIKLERAGDATPGRFSR
ncbi:MAG: D-aminoacyl-tRNA deacylase [Candidatus Hadarchaeota archaeon]